MQQRDHGDGNGGGYTGTVDVSIDVDIYQDVLGRIICNGGLKRVPRGVVRTSGLASEGVWAVWYRR